MTRSFRYYDLILGAFVAVLLCSNLIGPAKVVQLDLPFFGKTDFGAGILFFPLGYVIGDVLTEVYGYARARRCIWVGFSAMLFMAFMSWVVVSLPPAPGWTGQAAYESVFGQVPRPGVGLEERVHAGSHDGDRDEELHPGGAHGDEFGLAFAKVLGGEHEPSVFEKGLVELIADEG